MKLTAVIVDDEPVAVRRLQRLLGAISCVEVVGTGSNAAAVRGLVERLRPDVLFADIEMPGETGLTLVESLDPATAPIVIFVTAFSEYALEAFGLDSADYLLKPVEPEQLERAIRKLQHFRPSGKPAWLQSRELPQLLQELGASLRDERHEYPRRIASRVGERITFLNLAEVTHFQSQDKLTYAIANGRQHSVDQTITDLEQRLDPARFLRIHRAVLVNIDWILEVNSRLADRVVVTLKDPRHTQLPVARDRVRSLKTRLGI